MIARMEFFVYGRDRPSTGALRMELTEAHWSFMDRYDGRLIARGPTLTADGEAATGSVHIVDLPDLDAAHRFAFDEPYFRGGVFADVLIRRWHNVLGRTMWQFERELGGEQRFLVIGHAADASPEPRSFPPAGTRLDRLIAAGPLRSDDGTLWLGSVALMQQPDRASVEAVVRSEPYAPDGLYRDIEIHKWQFGGRR